MVSYENASESDKMWKNIKNYSYWVIGFLVIIIVLVGFTYGLKRLINYLEGDKSNDDKDKKDGHHTQLKMAERIEQLEQINQESSSIKEGKPGPPGPPGEQGPAGGIYTNNGPLRNLAQVDMVVDRMDGFGAMARPYLATQSYHPQQTWTLMTDKDGMGGILKNQYGGCLAMDKTNQLYMMADSNCQNSGTKWLFTAQGNIKPVKETNKCLSFTNTGMIKNLINGGKVNLKGKNVNMFNNLLELNLADCDSKELNQKWAFH